MVVRPHLRWRKLGAECAQAWQSGDNAGLVSLHILCMQVAKGLVHGKAQKTGMPCAMQARSQSEQQLALQGNSTSRIQTVMVLAREAR